MERFTDIDSIFKEQKNYFKSNITRDIDFRIK